MSLQKAIDILQDFQDRHADNWDKDFYDGFIVAKTILNHREFLDNMDMPIVASPDTQYKKDLTAWIERKERIVPIKNGGVIPSGLTRWPPTFLDKLSPEDRAIYDAQDWSILDAEEGEG